jgi:hypothetical protein
MKRLTAFSWGYWGWGGNHTRDFVRTVDAVERARGKRPPIFVDIRKSRSVRALGFRDAAFQEMVGKPRYQWMGKKLGNPHIVGRGKRGIRITDPSGGDDLLDVVADAQRDNRRVIFFCACKRPCDCHRSDVAALLVKVARRRGMTLKIVEWPGGDPETVGLTVSDEVVKGVLRDRKRVPLAGSSRARIRKLTALPWCSRVGLHSSGGDIAIISGPAQLAADWYLPVIGPDVPRPTDTVDSIRREAERLWKSLKYRSIAV